MKKRSNENSQLRPEEVDALNDAESTEGGIYTRAAPEVLAQRRMLKLKRPAPTSGSTIDKANPFAAFGDSNGLLGSNFSAPSVSTANPFGGFVGLVAPNAVKSTTDTFFNQSKSAEVNVKSGGTPLEDKTGNSAAVDSDYKSKMKKLNGSILSWMDRQIIEHPFSIWKDGLKDYIRYVGDISEKYRSDEKTTPATQNSVKPDAPSENRPSVPFSESKTFTGFNFPKGNESLSSSSATAASSNFFSGFSAPIAPINASQAGSSTTPKPVAAFNWNVPGLNTETKSFSVPSTSSARPPFSFGGGASTAASSLSSGGFGATPTAASGPSGQDGDDDEGEPIMEAEKVLRDEDDKDDIICECPCKLLRHDSGKGEKGEAEWTDVGKGSFIVTKCRETGKKRMLIRNSVGKIMFNAAFYKGMAVGRRGNNMLSFGAVVDESGVLKKFLLKLKVTDIETVLAAMLAAIDGQV